MTAIKKFRIAKGMTQEELAAIMGTSQAAVGMWETGARMPRADKLWATPEETAAWLKTETGRRIAALIERERKNAAA